MSFTYRFYEICIMITIMDFTVTNAQLTDKQESDVFA